jgi:hypothetical protein
MTNAHFVLHPQWAEGKGFSWGLEECKALALRLRHTDIAAWIDTLVR